jgi:hypothetical protein
MALLFFDLPAEIRRQIYCQLLISQADGEMRPGRICQGKGPHQTVQPAMLRVCKQMHNETIPILYGQNEFCIYVDFNRFKRFLCLIGKHNAALIRKIWFRSFGLLPGLHTELLEMIHPRRGFLKVLEKMTIVHSRDLVPFNRIDHHSLSCLVRSDLLQVRHAIVKWSKLTVMDEGGLQNDPKDDLKMHMIVRFAVSEEVPHHAEVRSVSDASDALNLPAKYHG